MWHYAPGAEAGWLYSVHVSVSPDQKFQTYSLESMSMSTQRRTALVRGEIKKRDYFAKIWQPTYGSVLLKTKLAPDARLT
jgi:hypothetical protein